MTDLIRWGILGASKFASEQMGPAIHEAKGAHLAGLATSSPDKAGRFQAFAPDLTLYDSYDALLAAPEIDAVYIPLPNHLHIEWSLKALAAGKPVLCEKPVALAADQIDPLIAARDAAGLLAAEAYMIAHHPQWHRARALLSEGAIGDLVHVEGNFTYDNRDAANIRNRAETGGGALPDIGVYPIGATRLATGREPTAVRARIDWEDGVDATSQVDAAFPGFTMSVLVSMRMAKRQEMTFHGTGGRLRLTAPFNAGTFGEARIELINADGERILRFPEARQYALQVESFGRSVRTGAPYPWTLEDARGTQAVLDAALAAGR